MTNTATVETLVAEVRVLMVGSRQVTLSVAKQLDEVDLDQLTVFGRIAMSNKGEHWVIGADAEGRLSRSQYQSWDRRFTCWIGSDALNGGRLTVCGAPSKGYESGESYRRYRLRLGEIPFEVDPDSTQQCGVKGHSEWSRWLCDQWGANGLEPLIMAELERQSATHAQDVALHAAARAAPLIVLAGLR